VCGAAIQLCEGGTAKTKTSNNKQQKEKKSGGSNLLSGISQRPLSGNQAEQPTGENVQMCAIRDRRFSYSI
jgi:hypothetical protein